jgi:hypothetical protein
MFEHGLPCRLCHNQLDSVDCLPADLWQCQQQPQPCGVEASSWIRQLHISFIRDNDVHSGCQQLRGRLCAHSMVCLGNVLRIL